MKALRKVIKEHGYTVVHIHQNSASMTMDAIAARLCGVKTIIGHSHNTRCNILWQHYLFRLFVNLFLTHRFACSKEAGKWIFGNHDDVTVYNNAIDTGKFCFDESVRQRYREKLGLQDRFVIGFVGRLHEQKNLFRFMDICRAVKEKQPDAAFLLIGEGGQEAELKEYAKKLGIDKDTHFPGRRKDVPNWMMAFDVLLMPSLYEGLPVVLAEAQSTGLSCVISDKVPCVDLIKQVTSISLEESSEVWAEKILYAGQLSDRKSAVQIVAAGGYDIETEAKKLEDFYLQQSR